MTTLEVVNALEIRQQLRGTAILYISEQHLRKMADRSHRRNQFLAHIG